MNFYIKKSLIFLPPLLLFVAAILFADSTWISAFFVAFLWFSLIAVRGRILLAYLALFSTIALWLIYSNENSLPLALLPLILASLVPGKRKGAEYDFNPTLGVTP